MQIEGINTFKNYFYISQAQFLGKKMLKSHEKVVDFNSTLLATIYLLQQKFRNYTKFVGK